MLMLSLLLSSALLHCPRWEWQAILTGLDLAAVHWACGTGNELLILQ
jgi:hypothetical protein